ncbi:hypothetical protein [Bacillus salipaludis]|uniref:hypothetical protein n=1 Tax=Bacillus salipaludis TaxID=2547811 RepID=UPI002E1DCC3B|nr:hypothetical protein [Bacillus salipaludis]
MNELKSFNKGQRSILVKKIESDDIGGLKVFLSDGHNLEAFPDSSEDDEQGEHWRFFNRKDNSPHFVVSGMGIEKV